MSKPPIYVLQMNLGGLTDRIIKMRWNENRRVYYDASGNASGNLSSSGKNDTQRTVFKQLVFANEQDAKNALKGALLVRNFLKGWL
jgi:hypothetical protein